MIRQWMLDYCDDVVNDEVVACQKHKQACKRFLRDIEREGSEDFPYVLRKKKRFVS